MKQKRKVKSLISSESGSNLLLTTLLFLLGGVLCFGAVSLFTSSVGVEASGPSSEVTYDGIDDKVEVIFDLSFAPEGDLGNAVSNMHLTTDGTFYMEGEVVNSSVGNSIDANNAYLLGGEGATIASDNVTLIGGSNNGSQNNTIEEDNPNTAILGGEGNVVSAGNNNNPAVLLGGKSNTIGANQDGDAIIGGNSNIIGGSVVNSYILGGEGNQIFAGSKNVIVGGKQVLLDRVLSNIFAFSDRTFSPKGSNAFYLYVTKGLGLGEKSEQGGVASKGPVSFGDVSGKSCTTANIGVQGTLGGCLVGCTQLGASNDKWELIDHGDNCEVLCNTIYSSSCMVYVPTPTPKPTYTSQCTVGNVDTSNSTQCASNLLNSYENVLFESYLIDSDDDCPNPNEVEDKCAFRCHTNFHLTGDKAGGTNKLKCYADCVVPWNNEIIKHNETRTGYNVETVSCSNTSYVFPRDTKIINFPTKKYTVLSNGKVKNGTSYESCTSHDHQKTIICKDGHLYLAKSNGQADTAKEVKRGGTYNYVYGSCTLQEYKCPTSVYNLDRTFITTTGKESSSISWVNTDRGITKGDRGNYKLCLDWTPRTVENGSACDKGSYATGYHYQLTSCKDNTYSTGVNHPYECRKKCLLDGKYYADGVTVLGYKAESVQCPNVCESIELTCHDGVWDPDVASTYKEDKCDVTAFNCPGYNVTQDTYDRHKNTSVYETCQLLKKNGIYECIGNGYKYKLTDCIGERHVNSFTDPQFCVDNYDWVSCDSNVTVGVGEEVVTGVPVRIIWIGGVWDGYWTSPAKCQKRCDDDHYGDPETGCYEKCSEKTCDSSYNLTSYSQCPIGGNCSSCTPMDAECNAGDTKWRFDGCKEDEGWYSDGAGGCKQNDPDPGDPDPEDPDPECLGDEPGDNTRPGSTSPASDKEWEYVSDTNATLGACQWTCKNNDYVRDGNTMNCKLNSSTPPSLGGQCTGSVPSNAKLVTGSDQGLAEDTTRTLYANSSAAAGKKCAYLCNTTNNRFYYGVRNECVYGYDVCGRETEYTCDIPAHSSNEGGDASKYTWDCVSDNGEMIEEGCYKCKTGYHEENGECKKDTAAITINICPSVTYSTSVDQEGHCYVGQALRDVSYIADKPLPTNVTITGSFRYNTIGNQATCTYTSEGMRNTYTIRMGNTESDELLVSSDVLHRNETTDVATVGFTRYFSPTFGSAIDKTSFTSSTGQEYIINLSDTPCGENIIDTSCTFRGKKIGDGDIKIVYLKNNPLCDEECKVGVVRCNGGTLTGDTGYGYFSCTTRTNNSCSGEGRSTTTGTTNATYATCTDAVGQSCVKKYKPNGCIDGYSLVEISNVLTCIPDLYVSVRVNVGGPFGGGYYSDGFGLLIGTGFDRYNPISGPSGLQPCSIIYQDQAYTCEFLVPASKIGETMWFVGDKHNEYGVVTYHYNQNLGALGVGGGSYALNDA